ncbi:MAG: virulence RhuM family protein [Candidatus Hydrogenedentes bacterium]|nr:virulence RhuM family protein [Candidatus Hydrogenedentota bacterium]
MNDDAARGERSDFLLYTAKDRKVNVEVFLRDETVWLTQRDIADLFGSERSVITKHLRNVFRNGELEERSVCAVFARTAADGKTYNTKYYNLDAIISVGYRVNSREAKLKAEQEFDVYRVKQDREYVSDFDREVRRISGKDDD